MVNCEKKKKISRFSSEKSSYIIIIIIKMPVFTFES